MKNFETTDGMYTHFLTVNEKEVCVGHHRGTGASEAAGTFSAEEFLSGRDQSFVLAVFGREVLLEAIEAAGGGPDDVRATEPRDG